MLRTSTQVFVGVLPAVLCTATLGLTYLSYAFGPIPVVSATDTLMMASGVLGTIGLAWSVRGYAPNKAVLIISLLLAGLAGMGTVAVRTLQDWGTGAYLGRVWSLSFLGWLVLFAWFVVGPIVVGLLQVWKAIRAIRAPRTVA